MEQNETNKRTIRKGSSWTILYQGQSLSMICFEGMDGDCVLCVGV